MKGCENGPGFVLFCYFLVLIANNRPPPLLVVVLTPMVKYSTRYFFLIYK